MTDPRRYKYPLQLPASLKDTAARLAREDGVSLNQWIVAAVAQKIGGRRDRGDLPEGASGRRGRWRLDALSEQVARFGARAG